MRTTTDGSSQDGIAALYDAASISKRLKDAQRRVNLNDSEMKEIIFQYIQDTPVMFENLNSAWKKSDHGDIFLYAHSIEGVARLFKFNEIGEYAKAIEDGAKAQNCPDEKTLKLLNEHHNASLDALRNLY